MNESNYNWAYIEGDLDVIFGYDFIDWERFGFTIPGIRWAVQNQYQLNNADGEKVSLFPIENEEAFYAATGNIFDGHNTKYRVVDQAECDQIHAELLKLFEATEARAARIPSEEETYQSQILQLITEIANNSRDILAMMVNERSPQNNG